MNDWQDNIGKIVLGDCMDVLRQIPDGAVDVLLTDPPYGNCEVRSTNYEVEARKRRGLFGNKGSRFEKYRKMAGAGHWKYGDEMTVWDVAPGPEVFQEMFRVSREQIIWGGNYFELPDTRCFNVWRKLTISEGFSMAMCEYAWTSYKTKREMVGVRAAGCGAVPPYTKAAGPDLQAAGRIHQAGGFGAGLF